MLLYCSGRSLGTAEVLFKSSDDAQKAIQQYNQVALDGKPMGLKLLDSAQPKRSVLKSSTQLLICTHVSCWIHLHGMQQPVVATKASCAQVAAK